MILDRQRHGTLNLCVFPCFCFPFLLFPLSVSFSLSQTLDAAESAECSLMDRDLMQVIFTLAKAGHQQYIPEMVERLRHERGYVPGNNKDYY